VLRFDEGTLVHELARLAPRARVAFAALCAERLVPTYEDFCRQAGRGNSLTLEQMLDRVWKHVLGIDEMSAEDIRGEINRAMDLIPGKGEALGLDEQAYADDAASAVAYTFRAMESGEPQEAAWAARRAYEAGDYYVTTRLGIEDEGQVLRHPIIQAEFARQRQDLQELFGITEEPGQVFKRLRTRAKADGRNFFAPPL